MLCLTIFIKINDNLFKNFIKILMNLIDKKLKNIFKKFFKKNE